MSRVLCGALRKSPDWSTSDIVTAASMRGVNENEVAHLIALLQGEEGLYISSPPISANPVLSKIDAGLLTGVVPDSGWAIIKSMPWGCRLKPGRSQRRNANALSVICQSKTIPVDASGSFSTPVNLDLGPNLIEGIASYFYCITATMTITVIFIL